MSDLLPVLKETIRREGPISVARYMALALGHPRHGYYTTRDPLGQAGDFTTAPEVSQMFGELIGLWVADLWQRAGSPAPLHLLELGPGRGTLMADVLRAARLLPGLADGLAVHLVEMSPPLRDKQRAALQGQNIKWHDSLKAALAEAGGPTIVIANEFLDALPIRQFIHTDGTWRERLIGWDEADDRLAFTLAPGGSAEAALIPPDVRAAMDGDIVETCPAALDLVGDLAAHLGGVGGAALFIDYGHARSGFGDTLQAVARHEFADPLADPGNADLTAHVDFARIRAAGTEAGLTPWGPVTQGAFLKALGIEVRTDRLRRSAPAKAQEVDAALLRLIGDDQMGDVFKALAFTGKDWPMPAGFAP